jgi:hypothetical protein
MGITTIVTNAKRKAYMKKKGREISRPFAVDVLSAF